MSNEVKTKVDMDPDRLRVSFWVIFGLTVFIAIARYVAWTYGY